MLLASSALLLPPSGGALAQDASSAGFALEEVVVTARRKDENIQDVPISISALGADALRSYNVQRLEDVMFAAPGFVSAPSVRGSNSSTYAMRGQRGANTQTALNDSPVSLYFAEFNLSRGVGTNQSMFDIENVQVLKGPQGTLFGRNSTGGAVLIQPRMPSNEFDGYAQVSGGDFDYWDVEGAVNVPLTETIAIRAGGKVTQRDGYTKNVVTGQHLDDVDAGAYRVAVRFQPVDSLTSTFIGTYFQGKGAGPAQKLTHVLPLGTPVLPGDAAGPVPAANQPFRQLLIANLQADLAASNALGFYEHLNSRDHEVYDRARSVQNNTTLEFGNLTLKNIIGARDVLDRYDSNIEGGLVDLFHYENGFQDYDSFSEELQLQGKLGRFDFVTGVYYFREEGRDTFDSVQLAYLGSPAFLAQVAQVNPALVAAYRASFPRTNHTDFEAVNSAIAAYAHTNYDLSNLVEGLSLSAGVRYTEDRRRTTYHTQLLVGPNPSGGRCLDTGVLLPTVDPQACSTEYSIESSEPTWNLGVNYRLTDDLLLYVTARSAYRAGGFNPVPPSPDLRSFEPETLDDYELGMKLDFTLGEMAGRFNVAAYYGKYEDIHRQVGTINEQGNYTSATINAAKATVSGGEVELMLRPISSLELAASYALVEPEYDEYNDLLLVRAGPPLVTETIDLTDAKFTNIPKDQLNLRIGWTIQLPQSSELTLGATYYYQSAMASGDPNTRNCGSNPTVNPYKSCYNYVADVPSYDIANVRIDWRNLLGLGVDVAVFVNNVLDEEYISSAPSAIPQLGFSTINFGPPRMYGVALNFPFGASAY